MLVFIAAKHAPHALPVKDLTGLPSSSRKKVCPARRKYHHVSKNPQNTGGQPVMVRKAVQFSVRWTTHSHQSFTVIQSCACFDYRHTQK